MKRILILILVVIFVSLLLFVNHSFGYYEDKIIYEKEQGSQTVILGVYTLENSTGNYHIENGKLYYIRSGIKSDYDDLNIPKKSVFTIQKDGSLLLDDNYLKDYYSNDVNFVVNNK